MMSVPGSDSSSGASMEARSRERVVSQMLFREVNERMRWLHTELGHDGQLSIVCECRNRRCLEELTLSNGAYDAIRLIPTHFIVKAGHEMPDEERVTGTHGGYIVVEKLGEDAVIAVRSDPRRRPVDRENAVAQPTSAVP